MITYHLHNNASAYIIGESGFNYRHWQYLSLTSNGKVEPQKPHTHWQCGRIIIYHEGNSVQPIIWCCILYVSDSGENWPKLSFVTFSSTFVSVLRLPPIQPDRLITSTKMQQQFTRKGEVWWCTHADMEVRAYASESMHTHTGEVIWEGHRLLNKTSFFLLEWVGLR